MTTNCQSCGMTIDDGIYCQYCTDDAGNLQSFDERLERMMQWTMRRDPGLSRDQAERQTLEYMATMPAWRDHPRFTTG